MGRSMIPEERRSDRVMPCAVLELVIIINNNRVCFQYVADTCKYYKLPRKYFPYNRQNFNRYT